MTSRRPARLTVLVSGAGSTMAGILEAAADDEYGAQVCAVIADRDGIRGLELASDAGIPTQVVRLGDFAERAQWDEAMAAAIAATEPDIVVCAGFMKILGPAVLARFGGRIVNTHPALLPSFPGAHGARDALAHGVKVTGCTVMLVDAGVDTGPILAQAAVSVRDNDTEETLHERIKQVERPLVAEVIGRMARDGWRVDGRVATLGDAKESE